MCGRYLIDEEAYSDILEILYRLGTMPDTKHSAEASAASADASAMAVPPSMREAMASTMSDMVSETVPDAFHDLFPGGAPIVTNGEVFPTNIAPVLTADGVRAVKWGFPHWKNSSVIINARAETALERQMFRKPLQGRRCVILSNGFYEWGNAALSEDDNCSFGNMQISLLGSNENFSNRHGGRLKKSKYLLRLPDESKLYMAGFFNTFRDAEGVQYDAFVILTTAANSSVSPIHDRMPLILSLDERDDWLGDTKFMEFALRRPGPELELLSA